nr:hypothetical protein Iba_chr10eCG12210 [Ipomoea batatas]
MVVASAVVVLWNGKLNTLLDSWEFAVAEEGGTTLPGNFGLEVLLPDVLRLDIGLEVKSEEMLNISLQPQDRLRMVVDHHQLLVATKLEEVHNEAQFCPVQTQQQRALSPLDPSNDQISSL